MGALETTHRSSPFPHTCEVLVSLGIDPYTVLEHGNDETGYLVLGRHPDGKILPPFADAPVTSRVPWPSPEAWRLFADAQAKDVSAEPRWKVACINWTSPDAPHATTYLLVEGAAEVTRYHNTWADAVQWLDDHASILKPLADAQLKIAREAACAS